MNKKHFAIGLLAVAIILLLWWLTHRPSKQASLQLSADETNQVAPAAEPPKNDQSNKSATVSSASEPTPESNRAAWVEKRNKQMEADRERVLDRWRTPIEFYGKVVDENTNAVVGARIDFDCNDTSLAGTSYYHAQSDTDGLFSIKGIQGLLLGVKVNKEGYYPYQPLGENFYYAGQNVNFTPDANNPIVFRLRKKGKAEPLITTDFPGFARIAQLLHDGTPVEVDLFKGEKVTIGNGQLKLEFWRDISSRKANVFDWKLQFSSSGGGLIETSEQFAFVAPTSGYSPSIVIDMPATNHNWQGEIKSKYYIQLPDGKYGRIELCLLPYNGVFTIHSIINPTGSRNLELQ